MKKYFSRLRILRLLCLLFTVGIFCICPVKTVHATELDTNLTGTTDSSTTINDAGTSETPDDLAELNIANTVTLTYNDNNGTVAGALRILLTLSATSQPTRWSAVMTSFSSGLPG